MCFSYRHLIELRKIEIEIEGITKTIIVPLLDYCGMQNLVAYQRVVDIPQSFPPSYRRNGNHFVDSEGNLHLVFEDVGKNNADGIFYDPLFESKPKVNYYFMMMYGFVPEVNINECVQTLIIPNESH